jgi:hypothetical protein
MKFSSLMCSALLGLTMASVPALADDMGARPARCFSMRDFNGWKAPDTRTLYIRAGVNQYYRLDLAATCSLLAAPDAHLVTKTVGSDQVCTGLDWQLYVSDSTSLGIGHDGFKQACIVKTQTPLSSEEVAAIPKKFKP